MVSTRKLGKILLLIPCLFLIIACKKDEAQTPTIKLNQLGSHDAPYSGILFINEYCHFEADINAPHGIAQIEVSIKQISGYATFSNTKIYTDDYVGLKEIQAFHDHPIVAVEDGGALGDYLFTIVVTDKNGDTSTVTSNIKVEVRDGVAPPHEHGS